MWCCSSRHCVRTSRRPRNTTRRRWPPWYVRVRPVRARVLRPWDGPNATTTVTGAPARVSFEFCRVREPETALSPLPDRRHYFPLSPRARTEFFFCAFSFVASRYKASRSPVSRPPRASRLLEPSARFPSVPRSQPATGDRVVRPGVSSKRSSREVPARRPTAKARRAARPLRAKRENGKRGGRKRRRRARGGCADVAVRRRDKRGGDVLRARDAPAGHRRARATRPSRGGARVQLER